MSDTKDSTADISPRDVSGNEGFGSRSDRAVTHGDERPSHSSGMRTVKGKDAEPVRSR